MNDKKPIEEMAVILTDGGCTECNCDTDGKFNCLPMYEAELLYKAGYRKQGAVIDDFVKRLLDAFPESNRDNRCPAIYYDDYRYIIEELAEKMKGGAE